MQIAAGCKGGGGERGREAEGGSGAEGMSKQREDRKERHLVACSRSYVIFREIFWRVYCRNVIILLLSLYIHSKRRIPKH